MTRLASPARALVAPAGGAEPGRRRYDTTQDAQDSYDVVVIGGGAAGLGGALVLARSQRSVVVVDGGQPRNAPAGGVHGYLTRDGMPPAELVRTGRLEVQGYGGRVLDGQVEQVERLDDGRLTVTLADGRTLTGRRLLVATGLVDELPEGEPETGSGLADADQNNGHGLGDLWTG